MAWSRAAPSAVLASLSTARVRAQLLLSWSCRALALGTVTGMWLVCGCSFPIGTSNRPSPAFRTTLAHIYSGYPRVHLAEGHTEHPSLPAASVVAPSKMAHLQHPFGAILLGTFFALPYVLSNPQCVLGSHTSLHKGIRAQCFPRIPIFSIVSHR